MISRTDRAAAGFVTSIIQLSVVAILQFALVPIILRAAGRETLGAYAALSQILLFLALMDLGFGLATSRFLAQAFGYDDSGRRFADVLATARRFYAYMNAGYGALAALICPFAPRLLSLDGELANHARVSLLMIAVWAVARIPLAAYVFGLIGAQRLATVNLLSTVGNACKVAASILFVLAGGGLIGIVGGSIVGEAVAMGLQRAAFVRSSVGRSLPRGRPERRLFGELFSYSRYAVFLNVASYVTFYSDNILASYLYGPAAAARYYVTVLPAQQAWSVIMRLMNNAAPGLNELIAKGEWEKVRNAYYRVIRYSLILALPLGLGILALNRTLVALWVGSAQYAGASIAVLLALYAPWIVLANVQAQFLFAAGEAAFLSKLCIAESVLKLILSLLLGYALGLLGILLGTLLSSLLVAPWNWRLCMRSLCVRPSELLRRGIAPPAGWCAPLLIVALPSALYPEVSIGAAAATLLAFGSLWAGLAWWGVLSPDERSYVRLVLQRLGTNRKIASSVEAV